VSVTIPFNVLVGILARTAKNSRMMFSRVRIIEITMVGMLERESERDRNREIERERERERESQRERERVRERERESEKKKETNKHRN
jgi:hypothetical protein